MAETGTDAATGQGAGPHGSEKWRARRAREVERAGYRAGPDFLYLAGDVLVGAREESALADDLRQLGGRPDGKANRELTDKGFGIRRWQVPAETDVPAVLRGIRGKYADQGAHRRPALAVNHLVSGEPFYHGGPGSFPRVTGRLPDGPRSAPPGDRSQLAVLDTGIPAQLAKWHPRLAERLRADSDDIDALDLDGDGLLDFEAGHGTFICGLVQRVAPNLAIDPEQVLDSFGFGTDLGVALALSEVTAPVVNLSLGGYTEGDRPPPLTAAALRALRPDVVVVAAAGNHGSDRPFWPAAFKRVISVAAVDTTVTPAVPAGFSNFGWWVDVCAPGVDLHAAYVQGRRQDDDTDGPADFEGWASWSGTSFAAPLVAAAIAAGVAGGGAGPVVAAELTAALASLPGHPEYGRYFDPGVDLTSV